MRPRRHVPTGLARPATSTSRSSRLLLLVPISHASKSPIRPARCGTVQHSDGTCVHGSGATTPATAAVPLSTPWRIRLLLAIAPKEAAKSSNTPSAARHALVMGPPLATAVPARLAPLVLRCSPSASSKTPTRTLRCTVLAPFSSLLRPATTTQPSDDSGKRIAAKHGSNRRRKVRVRTGAAWLLAVSGEFDKRGNRGGGGEAIRKRCGCHCGRAKT